MGVVSKFFQRSQQGPKFTLGDTVYFKNDYPDYSGQTIPPGTAMVVKSIRRSVREYDVINGSHGFRADSVPEGEFTKAMPKFKAQDDVTVHQTGDGKIVQIEEFNNHYGEWRYEVQLSNGNMTSAIQGMITKNQNPVTMQSQKGPKFKPGDKVIHMGSGQSGVIEKYSPYGGQYDPRIGDYKQQVRLDNVSSGTNPVQYWYEGFLVAAPNQKTKFNIGDKVRVTKNPRQNKYVVVGDTGEITQVDHDPASLWPYHIKADGKSYGGWFAEDEIEFVQQQQQQGKFKPGDKVYNSGFMNSKYPDGTEFEIVKGPYQWAGHPVYDVQPPMIPAGKPLPMTVPEANLSATPPSQTKPGQHKVGDHVWLTTSPSPNYEEIGMIVKVTDIPKPGGYHVEFIGDQQPRKGKEIYVTENEITNVPIEWDPGMGDVFRVKGYPAEYTLEGITSFTGNDWRVKLKHINTGDIYDNTIKQSELELVRSGNGQSQPASTLDPARAEQIGDRLYDLTWNKQPESHEGEYQELIAEWQTVTGTPQPKFISGVKNPFKRTAQQQRTPKMYEYAKYIGEGPYQNMVGKVISIDPDSDGKSQQAKLQFPDHQTYWYYFDEIEPIPTFGVGDKVTEEGGTNVGKVIDIQLTTYGEPKYTVEWTSPDGSTYTNEKWGWYLQSVDQGAGQQTPQTSRQPMLKPGDRVFAMGEYGHDSAVIEQVLEDPPRYLLIFDNGYRVERSPDEVSPEVGQPQQPVAPEDLPRAAFQPSLQDLMSHIKDQGTPYFPPTPEGQKAFEQYLTQQHNDFIKTLQQDMNTKAKRIGQRRAEILRQQVLKRLYTAVMKEHHA